VNTASPSQVRALLTDLDVRPSSRLGQNFLIDANIRDISITRAGIAPGDRVLEIGPGLGILTEGLLAAGATVMAVEMDRRLHAYLKQRFAHDEHFLLEHGDALKLDFNALFDPAGQTRLSKVVANLPYASGTRMLVEMFQACHRPTHIVVTLQREVVQRICAAPSTSAYGLLSVWAQQAYVTRVEHQIQPGCFWPAPDVASAIAGLSQHDELMLRDGSAPVFYALTKHAFSQRRKQLCTILNRYPGWKSEFTPAFAELLAQLGHNSKARPEELSPSNWVHVSEFVADVLAGKG
jgi:16S rRNA (adenine1518-N6/adenine1519-N6)-dimethyltransferase